MVLGPDLLAGQHVQLLVPAGVWQGTRLIGDGQVALLGCTVVPGFDFSDYSRGSYADLAAAAHLSCVDYLGDAPWSENETAKAWYARIKSRPSFRPLLAERLTAMQPSPTYADLDF